MKTYIGANFNARLAWFILTAAKVFIYSSPDCLAFPLQTSHDVQTQESFSGPQVVAPLSDPTPRAPTNERVMPDTFTIIAISIGGIVLVLLAVELFRWALRGRHNDIGARKRAGIATSEQQPKEPSQSKSEHRNRDVDESLEMFRSEMLALMKERENDVKLHIEYCLKTLMQNELGKVQDQPGELRRGQESILAGLKDIAGTESSRRADIKLREELLASARRLKEDAQAEAKKIKAMATEESKSIRDSAETERQRFLADADESRRQAEELRKAAHKEREETSQALERVKKSEAELRSSEEKLEAKERDLLDREIAVNAKVQDAERQFVDAQAARDKAHRERSAAQLEREAAQAARDAEQAARDAAEALKTQAETSRNTLESLRTRIWPSFALKDSLKPRIGDLESRAVGGNANAGILLAYLSLYRAIDDHSVTRKDFNYLWPTVREIGRFLVATMDETSIPPQKSAETLAEWAKLINEDAAGRFTLRVPSVGNPVSSTQMEAKSEGIQTVSRVINWSVSNSKSIIVSKAEVS